MEPNSFLVALPRELVENVIKAYIVENYISERKVKYLKLLTITEELQG